MLDSIEIVLFAIVLAVFFYLGYREDYRKDKKNFIITIVSIFISGIVFVFVSQIFAVILLPVFMALYKKNSKGNKK